MTDHDKLAAWFQDYSLWRALQHSEDEPEAGMDTAAGFQESSRPAEGQIRLWPGGELPLYGLLIRSEYDQWTVIPFSVLSEPAVPQELRIRTSGPAQVLQGWNARRLGGRQVAESWKADDLQEEEQFRVEGWWLAVEAGAEPPPLVRDHVGPPLRHPLDPRQEYLLSEANRSDGILGEPVATYGLENDSLPLAAENPEENYGEEE